MTTTSLPSDLSVGIHSDVPEATYHADRRTLSQSGAKLILDAPAKFRWQQDHPPKSKAVFDFGKAAHHEVLGVGAELVIFNYDERKIIAPKQTKAWKEKKAELGDQAVLLLPDEYDQVQAMAARIREHRMAMRLLAAGEPEVSAYSVDEETGVPIRGRCDWLGETVVTDYKTTTCSEPSAFLKSAFNWGYHQQHAWYLDLFAACGHPADAFAFIAQEKEPPYIVTVIELPAELVDLGRQRNRRALEIYRDCMESGRWPGYVSDDEFAQPEVQPWMLRDEE